MIALEGLPAKQLAELRKQLNDNTKLIKREAATAINATAQMAKRVTNKQIRDELATTKAAVDKAVTISRRANAGQLGATVRLKKEGRLSLRFFGPKQNKRGVSYKISKKQGRQFVAGAFQGPRPGAMKVSWRGNAFVRVGKSRLPIVKLKGPSPWGVIAKKKLEGPTAKQIEQELAKQLDRRIRLLLLRAEGKVK